MLNTFLKRYTIVISFCCLLLIVSNCVDPQKPEFNYIAGLVYIDAFVSTEEGESFVKISESGFEFNRFENQLFITGANISFRNTETNSTISLNEFDDIYLPPEDFKAFTGETWELIVNLPNGKIYKSLPETIIKPIEFSDLKSTYKPDLEFREGINDFIPGHFISIDLNDPQDETNYYYWRYKSFEVLKICATCSNSIYRDGECNKEAANPMPFQYTVSYWCDTDCWKIRFNENIKVFSDEFSNGQQLNALAIADVPYYINSNILVEVQQYSLTKSAYEYFRVLKDVLENVSGINAPPPAILVGNLFNPDDNDEFVLGRFTAASATKHRLFIDRSNIPESPITPFDPLIQKEWCALGCPPQECEEFTCDPITQAPCTETRYRTGIMPNGWIEN